MKKNFIKKLQRFNKQSQFFFRFTLYIKLDQQLNKIQIEHGYDDILVLLFQFFKY